MNTTLPVWLRRALSLLGKIFLAMFVAFAVLLLVTRYVILPEVGRYKSNIEEIASSALGNMVTIAHIDASWQGINPTLDLGHVVLYDKEGQAALILKKVQATLSWRSLLARDLRFENLTIFEPELSIVRYADGRIFVAGLSAQSGGDNRGGLDWLLAQHEIVIKDGRVRWRDDVRHAPELALDNVNVALQNKWRHHRLILQATPPAAYAAPIDIRADFVHPALTKTISDISRWKGTLYADLKDTDLAVWSRYVDYPFEVTQGTGSVRAWLDLNQARVENFTADLNLSHLSARLGADLAPLQLKTVQGRVSARETGSPSSEEGVPTFGAAGHTVELIGFSLETDDGLILSSASVSESFEAATSRQPEKMRLQSSLLDLATMSDLAGRLPLTPSQRQMLSDFAPAGKLHDFTLEWQGSYPDIVSYRLRGDFSDLSVKHQPFRPAQKKTKTQAATLAFPALPGTSNVTGSIDATEKGGTLVLASKDALLKWPEYLDNTMSFTRLDMRAHWAMQADDLLQVTIEDMQYAQEGLAGSAKGTHTLSLNTPSLGYVDLQARLSSFDVSTIGRYLPAATSDDLRHWLTGALVKGRAHDVDVVVRGELKDFPFNQTPVPVPMAVASVATMTDIISPGARVKPPQFSVNGKFSDLTMNYQPGYFGKDGKSPEWPLLEKANGTINIDRARLRIHADNAQTNTVPLTNVHATVADLASDDAVLEIDGHAAGNMQKMLEYVEISPVAGWIEHFTQDTKATGKGRVHLKFQMPIAHGEDTKVQGVVELGRNDVDLLTDLPRITAASGRVEFNEKGFSLKDLKGQFLGGPVEVSGGTLSNGTTLVKAQGVMDMDGVRATYPQPALQSLLTHAQGSTPYDVDISLKERLLNVTVNSLLRGVTLDLPAPFGKGAAEAWPMQFVLRDIATQEGLGQRDEIALRVGKLVDALYVRQKHLGIENKWRVVSGGVGINQPAPRPDAGVTAYLNLDRIDMDKWMAFDNTPPGVATDSAGLEARELSDYIATALVAKTNALTIAGRTLHDVILGASRQKDIWQLNIDSRQGSGYATWSEPRVHGDFGHVVARLSALNIPKAEAGQAETPTQIVQNQTIEIPELDIIAEDFQLFGRKLGRLELNARTEKNNMGREWRIKKLQLSNPDGEFRSAGNWISAGKNSTSNLTYALDIQDAGKLLERFGFTGALRGGKGKLDGDISWKGTPFALHMPSLSGQMYVDVQKGQFLQIDPGGGAKLLGVLSLQSLPRRLALDFRDVFSSGFAFDDIVGDAKISRGVLTTDNLKMRSVTADVTMKGSANIAAETQDLHVTVVPDINLGAASVVAMTLNPVVGVSTFLTQLFLRGPLKDSMTFEYDITGAWQDPIVTKLGKNRPEPEGPTVEK